jgi:hypothetical protein
MTLFHTVTLVTGLLLLASVACIGGGGILISRPEKPERHTHRARRIPRRDRRAASRAEDDQTAAWLARLKRPRVRPLAIGRARVAGLLAVLPAPREPLAQLPPARCVFCGHQGLLKAWHGGELVCADDGACLARGPSLAPVVWETVEGRPVRTAEWSIDDEPGEPLPLSFVASAPPESLLMLPGPDPFASLPHGAGAPAEADVTIVDLTVVGPLPPNARAGYWQPRAVAAPWPPVLDFDPAIDDPGLRHLRYPWADQSAADFR